MNAFAEHNCFGCGALNPHGLRLRFYEREHPDGGVWAPWTPSPTEEGYVGMVHGGIVSTVLDEVMAWACYRKQIWGVTGRLNVRFRKPVVVGMATRAEGWIVQRRGRVLELAAELRAVETGQLLADATATFMRVPESQAAEWQRRYGPLEAPAADRPVSE